MSIKNLTKCAFAVLALCMLTTAPLAAATTQSNGCCKELNCCSDDPCCPDTDWCTGYNLCADFILWKPCFNDLDYAIVSDTIISAGIATGGQYKYVDHDYEPGLRLRFSKDGFWCGWDLEGSYTYLHSSETDSVVAPQNGEVVTTLFHGGINSTASGQFAAAKHKFRYQSFDLLLGHDCCICPCHTLHPFVGVTGLFLKRSFDHRIQDAVVNPGDTANYKWHSCFDGIGLKVGSRYEFCFCDGWGFYSILAGSVVTGSQDTDSRFVGGNSANNDLSFKSRACRCVPGFQFATGFTYNACACGKEYTLRLGYEFVEWFNTPTQNRYYDSGQEIGLSNSPTGSSVGFHGLLAGLCFNF